MPSKKQKCSHIQRLRNYKKFSRLTEEHPTQSKRTYVWKISYRQTNERPTRKDEQGKSSKRKSRTKKGWRKKVWIPFTSRSKSIENDINTYVKTKGEASVPNVVDKWRVQNNKVKVKDGT